MIAGIALSMGISTVIMRDVQDFTKTQQISVLNSEIRELPTPKGVGFIS